MRSRLEHKGFGAGVGKPVGKLIFNKNAEPMKTYYAIVNVEERRLGTYVRAEHVAAAFETATARDKARHPRLQVETIAVQEIAEEYVDPAHVSLIDAAIAHHM